MMKRIGKTAGAAYVFFIVSIFASRVNIMSLYALHPRVFSSRDPARVLSNRYYFRTLSRVSATTSLFPARDFIHNIRVGRLYRWAPGVWSSFYIFEHGVKRSLINAP